MIRTDAAIIGAGLSGLQTAALLANAGIDYLVIEAQQQVGGRVRSVRLSEQDAYDLGPTWYWPAVNPRMVELVAELGLRSFAQATEGTFVYELSAHRHHHVASEPSDDGTRRIEGGMQCVIDAVSARLAPERVRCGSRVIGMHLARDGVRLDVIGDDGAATILASRVVCTLPPRLLAATVLFAPSLPSALMEDWLAIPTWMAAHAKFVAVYDEPFWRAAGFSGAARSQVGPMVEIHDASPLIGRPALFGFLGVSATERRAAGEILIRDAALSQLTRIFGERASTPQATLYEDWSTQPFVATAADMEPPASHPMYGTHAELPGPWATRLVLAGTETAPTSGGYLEGALEASELAVTRITSMPPER